MTHVPYFAIYFLLDEIVLQQFLILVEVVQHPSAIFNRILSELQLIGNNSQGPYIDFLIKGPLYDLRSHVLYGPLEGGNSFAVFLPQHLREAVVSQFDVPFIGDKYILRFQAAVDNTLLVKILKSNYDLRENCLEVGIGQFDGLLVDVEVKITFGKVLHNDIDVVPVLPYFYYAHQKGIAPDAGNYVRLQEVVLLDSAFGNQLHCIFDLGFKVLDQDYGAQLSFSQQLFGGVFGVHGERCWCWLFLPLAFRSICCWCDIWLGLGGSCS